MDHGDIKILVLSGKAADLSEQLRKICSHDSVSVIQLEEKSLLHARKIFDEIRDRRYRAVAFGCRSLDSLRYEFVISTFLICARARRKYIVDESGRSKEIRLLPYVLWDIPRFGWETMASAIVIVLTFFRLLILRKRLTHGPGRRA
jgi:hypothetical protein